MNRGGYSMTFQEQYERLIELFIERENLSIIKIQNEAKVRYNIAEEVYEEWQKYHDEEYWSYAMSEISHMDEVPTPIRIMCLLDISYYFSQKLLEYYLEMDSGI